MPFSYSDDVRGYPSLSPIGDVTHRNLDRINIEDYSMEVGVRGSLNVPSGKSLSSSVPSGKRQIKETYKLKSVRKPRRAEN